MPAQPKIGAAAIPPLLDDDDPALFPKLTDVQLALLSPYGQVRNIELGNILFRPGEIPSEIIVLLAGEVTVTFGEGDRARTIALQRPRDLLAELNVLTGQRNAATGLVTESGSALFVPQAAIREIISRDLVFGAFILDTLFRRRHAIERLVTGIQIIGSRFDRNTHRLREFATRNRLLHVWLDIDTEDIGQIASAYLTEDGLTAPIAIVGSDVILRNPSNSELARAVGLRDSNVPAEKSFDLVVIGAGPGGLAAGVYGAAGGMSTAILDAVAVGGQAATSARIENYLGFPAGISGADLAERSRLQATKFGARIIAPCRAVGLTERDGYHVVALDSGDELIARTIILATGVQYRRLPVPRIAEYEGLGVAYAADAVREQIGPRDNVVVVGGANSAGQAALSLVEEGRHVHLVVRGGNLAAGMARYLRDRISGTSDVEVLLQHEVRELLGEHRLEAVLVKDVGTGEVRRIAAGGMIVLIGAIPKTDWLAADIALDAEGFVLTGPQLGRDLRDREPWTGLGRGPYLVETGRPGVFAVGDVRSGSTKMVAPAVGEGGMAVRFAAEHLARPIAISRPASH
jgi:thioredoxin reductase (NADPH)